MKFLYVLCTMLVFAVLILTGCGLQDNTAQQTSTTSTAFPFGDIPSLTPSPIDQPTQTLVPMPTLSEEDALGTFINLIAKDSECDLPCWLNVTPGQTKFEEVENIFLQFSTIASIKSSSQSAFIRVFFPNFETAIHNTATEVNPSESGNVSRIRAYAVVNPDANGNINYSNPEFQRMWQRYFVPGIFLRHGVPEKIFLDTTLIAADTVTSYPFVLWVVYPQQGFLVRYQGLNTRIGDNIRICPLLSRIEIKIWDVEESSYEEFIKDDRALGISTSLGPQPIESVTDFDIESFYEVFKDGEVNTCFETPASIWPH